MSERLPEPRLTKIFRLEASLGEALDLGNVALGRRRIVPQTGGTFAGPELTGTLLPGASADWQIVLPDGTALGDIRFTLQTDRMNSSLEMTGKPEDDYVTVRGDIAEAQTARKVVEQALNRFARMDCLVNDAGVFSGLAAVTRALATEYASRGVRVNAVSLGVIKTSMHDTPSYKRLRPFDPRHVGQTAVGWR